MRCKVKRIACTSVLRTLEGTGGVTRNMCKKMCEEIEGRMFDLGGSRKIEEQLQEDISQREGGRDQR